MNAPNTMNYGTPPVYAPIFNKGRTWGVSINRPNGNMPNLESIAASSTPPALFNGNDVALTFFGDGRVNVRIPPSTGAMRNDTVPITSVTSNGVIAVKNGDVRVKGVYHGQVTVTALKGTAASGTKGNVWIDGDIVAGNNPQTNPSSTDMLGLVAERMMYLTTTGIPRLSTSVVNIQAALYAHTGVFAAENYNTIGLSGRISLYGALSMNASTATGKMSGGVLVGGFLKSLRFDSRYATSAPPSFPRSDRLRLVAWYEK
jgi:hypothetical protein